jgi:hypothetical protein
MGEIGFYLAHSICGMNKNDPGETEYDIITLAMQSLPAELLFGT